MILSNKFNNNIYLFIHSICGSKISPENSIRIHYKARGNEKIEGEKKLCSYDYGIRNKHHTKRIVLRAQPQIGKTHAYFQFLKLVKEKLETKNKMGK